VENSSTVFHAFQRAAVSIAYGPKAAISSGVAENSVHILPQTSF
jgi:hypothetical protein